MNVTKFGETYNIKEERETYVISGDLIKTVNGNVIINVATASKEGDHIADITGDYRVTDSDIAFNFKAPIARYDEQFEIIDDVITAVKSIL
jgi:hypothetical protein